MKAYRNLFIVAIGGALILAAGLGVLWHAVWWLLVLLLPPALLGVYDLLQKKHTLLRIYPVIGHLRTQRVGKCDCGTSIFQLFGNAV